MTDEPAASEQEEPDVKVPNWVKLVTGMLVPTSGVVKGSITTAQWLGQQRGVLQEIRSAELHLNRLREDLAALESMALERRDLRQAAREEALRVAPAAPAARRDEELVRVRVCEQFATEYERLLYVGNPGDVQGLPLGLVEQLGARVARVSPDTPLHLFQPVVEPRR